MASPPPTSRPVPVGARNRLLDERHGQPTRTVDEHMVTVGRIGASVYRGKPTNRLDRGGPARLDRELRDGC